MARIIREITVDVAQLNRFAAIVAKQYDKQSRFLKVTLVNNDEPITVEKGATVLINARREDDVAKSFIGEVNSDGTVTVPLTYWMLELDGTVKCDISIIVGNESTLTTTLFELEVEEAASDDESVSKDEDYGLIVNLIKTVQSTTQAANTATSNANKATKAANDAATAANTAKKNADTATANADNATKRADNATASATKASETASNAASSANTAASAANKAVTDVGKAVEQATAAKEACANMVANAQFVTQPMLVADMDTGKQYTAAIQVKDGKPFMVYEEISK